MLSRDLSANLSVYASTMGRWSDGDDAKLAQLWRSGKLDPAKLDSGSIHKALLHFGGPEERSYDSFATLYKRKAAKWKVEQTLKGARRGGSRCKFQQTSMDHDAFGRHCLTYTIC